MTSPQLYNDDVARLLAQMGELQQRVLRGNVDLYEVRRGLQLLIEGRPVRNAEHGRLFASCAQQLLNLERWNNEHNWGISDRDIARCYLEARTFEWPGDRLQALVLVPSLATPGETFLALIEVAAESGLRTFPYSLLASSKVNPSRVQLVEGVEFHPNSLEWRLVDLGAHARQDMPGRGSYIPSSSELVTPDLMAHAEVLAAAAHFPEWLRALRKKQVPKVNIPGYILSCSASAPTEYPYVSLMYDNGDIGPTLHGCVSDTVWDDGTAVATARPASLGSGL